MSNNVCAECGASVPSPSTGRPRLTCSPECKAVRDARLRAERKASYGECEIEECSKTKRSSSSPWCEMHYGRNRFNGDPRATRVSRPYTGICYQCGGPAARQRLFCDLICQRRDRMGAVGRTSDCTVCEGPLPEGAHLNTVYCSRDCERFAERARLYGVDAGWLKETAEAQGRCAICDASTELVVDHDHATGLYRGLLCANCNVGIGMFADDPARLLAAVSYLGGENGLGDKRQEVEAALELALTTRGSLPPQGAGVPRS